MNDKPSNYKTILILILIFAVIVMTFKIDNHQNKPARLPIPKHGKAQYVKGIDYSKASIEYTYYSDAEIRQLREGNSGYIIKTPGRIVLTEQQQYKKDFEELLEDNPDLLDEYLNE